MKDIVLVGGGGHSKSVIDAIKSTNEFNIVGILDSKESINAIKVLGKDSDAYKVFNQGYKNIFIAIGSIGDTKTREKLYAKLKSIGFEFPVIIDKTAIISENVVIGEGSFIGKGVIINSNSEIGNNCIINTGAIIEHDCIIKDFVHIAPGCTLSGGVNINANSHIGTNSTIIQGIKIGTNTLIGAGSVVVKDIANNKKAYGNPCKEVM